MQAGVDALMDVMAPPVRAPRDASAPARDDGPSFEDHLDAAEPPPPTERPQRAEAGTEEEAPVTSEPATDVGDEAEPTQTAAQPAPQQPAPPVNPITLQIINTIASAAAPADEAPIVADAEPTAPQQSTPQTPPPVAPPTNSVKPHAAKARAAEPHAKTNEAAPTQDAADAPATDAEQPKQDASAKVAAPSGADQQHTSDNAQTAPQQSAPPQQNPTHQQQQQQQQPPQHVAAPAQPAKTQSTDSDNTAPLVADAAAAPTPKETPRPNHAAPQSAAAESASDQQQEQASPTERDTRRADAADQPAAPKQAGPTSTPTTAPRETFTALLAQQEGAMQPLASHTAIHSTTPTSAAMASSATATAHAAATAPPATQVGREIIRKFIGENTRFELRLDPPELGRVEVKLEVSRDHRVTAVVAADSPQTLADLTRHARDLEQALQSAGLELSDDGLRFDLSQHRENFADARDEQSGGRSAQAPAPQDSSPVTSRALTLDAWRGARVDLVA